MVSSSLISLPRRLCLSARSAEPTGACVVEAVVQTLIRRQCIIHSLDCPIDLPVAHQVPVQYCRHFHLCRLEGTLYDHPTLCTILIYDIQMGTTGSSDAVAMNKALPEIIDRVKQHSSSPLAVGFGVSNRDHFEAVASAGAEGVVVGSRLAAVIKASPDGQIPQKVEEYIRTLSLKFLGS